MTIASARSLTTTGVFGRLLTATAWRTNSATSRSSRCRRIAPASNREISSRSSTSDWKRATSPTSRSSAAAARSGRSSRRACITSALAASVISGERSSWLTSLAKRASRSTRVCSASAMSLNAFVNVLRSGSSDGSRRVSIRPPAIALAAWAASPSGRTARRAANEPISTPASVVMIPPNSRLRLTLLQRRLHVAQREELEVRPVARLQREADDQGRLAVDAGDLPRGDAVVDDPLAQRRGDRVAPVHRIARHPLALVEHGDAQHAELPEPAHHVGRRAVVAEQLVLRHLGVAPGLLDGGALALVDDAGTGEAVADGAEEDRQEQRAQHEHHQHPGAQAEALGPQRLDPVDQRAPLVGGSGPTRTPPPRCSTSPVPRQACRR